MSLTEVFPLEMAGRMNVFTEQFGAVSLNIECLDYKQYLHI